ncbi:uncharacterized protein [Arachis hypogaea]|uniref:uncharacterized protein n=1 Tax=Arachis hypogaea TaxID=3818 RepID=UPI000DEC6293|nr:uncharacterized protein LOC112750876 [Arachis hypogaea]XP_029148608.1 uncharacterized protein LOC112750876 [Arachis hypogaea]XP_029148609.1 uncharacterized protein LOC112750876 [Arachis hypogaea]XP_029148611.1 uncharacterized protein LOC112750876 [Arachis hypogaea]XP_029148616.1 uncharacterized protein LOC112750876 [Arachis hypogaea]XP_029148617.1 uncharacterized protein LOC112750876 [Arachis hypogaea]XP_029148618.1 uncharacterized protein LOC112750876 [Arachis hypogaea]XP_029148619.1 unc
MKSCILIQAQSPPPVGQLSSLSPSHTQQPRKKQQVPGLFASSSPRTRKHAVLVQIVASSSDRRSRWAGLHSSSYFEPGRQLFAAHPDLIIMAPDRSWMSRRQDCTGHLSEEFKKGVVEFLYFVERNPTVIDSLGRILCPCTKCKNRIRDEIFWVEKYLCDHGFIEGYTNWTAHGEERWVEQDATNVTQEHEEENTNPYVDMVIDAAGDNLNVMKGLEEDPNPSASKFYKLLRSADEPLWDGYTKHTILSAVTQLVNLKSEFNMSESCYNRMVAIIKSMLPESEKLLEDFYRSKTMIQELRLGYDKIDACPNHCMLYYKETSDKTSYAACTMCGHP